MGLSKRIKLIEEINEENNKVKCKGRVYRGSVRSFFSSYGSIEVRKSLRLLKNLSCPGCEKCGWMEEFLFEDCLDDPEIDYLPEIEDKKMYQFNPIWHPGPFEYPEEGELEANFIRVDK